MVGFGWEVGNARKIRIVSVKLGYDTTFNTKMLSYAITILQRHRISLMLCLRHRS